MPTLITQDIQEAIAILKKGIPVAFPTETVYGLGAGVFDEKALKQIYKIKNRPEDNPLIVHISHLDMVKEVAVDIPAVFYDLAEAFMPGPLSVILKKHPKLPKCITCNQDTVAIRFPSHPVALSLIEAFGMPIAAPSANLSGKPSATQIEHVLEDFDGKIPLVLQGGKCSIGIESTVLLIEEDQLSIVRPGSLSAAEIQKKVLLPVVVRKSLPEGISPGVKYRHYAPKAEVKLIYNEKEIPSEKGLLLSEEKVGSLRWLPLEPSHFYAALRQADQEGFDKIYILLNENILNKEGFLNRILKSAGL